VARELRSIKRPSPRPRAAPEVCCRTAYTHSGSFRLFFRGVVSYSNALKSRGWMCPRDHRVAWRRQLRSRDSLSPTHSPPYGRGRSVRDHRRGGSTAAHLKNPWHSARRDCRRGRQQGARREVPGSADRIRWQPRSGLELARPGAAVFPYASQPKQSAKGLTACGSSLRWTSPKSSRGPWCACREARPVKSRREMDAD